MKQKSPGGKLGRTEIVTVRLDPQLRYLIELAARKQRRTVSSYIEWVTAKMINDPENGISKIFQETWDVDEEVRLENLSKIAPDFLTFEEQIKLKGKTK